MYATNFNPYIHQNKENSQKHNVTLFSLIILFLDMFQFIVINLVFLEQVGLKKMNGKIFSREIMGFTLRRSRPRDPKTRSLLSSSACAGMHSLHWSATGATIGHGRVRRSFRFGYLIRIDSTNIDYHSENNSRIIGIVLFVCPYQLRDQFESHQTPSKLKIKLCIIRNSLSIIEYDILIKDFPTSLNVDYSKNIF